MSDETKVAVRLLVECMDELRNHDSDYKHRTSAGLKKRLQAYFESQGADDPVKVANLLCDKLVGIRG